MVRINSRQVEAFRATMLTGSVTEAAKLMVVTQPAVSRLLRDFQGTHPASTPGTMTTAKRSGSNGGL